MKIGILTLPFHTNYGGIMQAYALQTVLERMGHQTSFLVTKFFRLPYYDNMSDSGIRLLRRNTDRFIDEYLHGRALSLPTDNSEGYEAIVVGSDQVWRYPYFSHMVGDYPNGFLSFAEDWAIRRISYAPSFGNDVWEAPADVTALCRKLLQKFDAVSVREESGITLCKEFLGRDAKLVLDPTMLLARNEYSRLIDSVETDEVPANALVDYILDRTDEKLSLIVEAGKAYGLKVVTANSRVEDISAPLHERIQPSPEQWLRSFRDAEMIITDSFHATVFSIIFNKRFIVTGNPDRGLARIYSILKMFGLEDHFVADAGQFDATRDYCIPNTTYERLKLMYEDSYEFLKNSLSNF